MTLLGLDNRIRGGLSTLLALLWLLAALPGLGLFPPQSSPSAAQQGNHQSAVCHCAHCRGGRFCCCHRNRTPEAGAMLTALCNMPRPDITTVAFWWPAALPPICLPAPRYGWLRHSFYRIAQSALSLRRPPLTPPPCLR